MFGACISFWLGLCAAAAGQDTAGLWVTQQSVTSRGHIVHRHPEWIMVPRDLAGRLARLDVQDLAYLAAIHRWTQPSPDGADGLYLSPILPEVAEHIGERLTQFLARYRFDGVHLGSTQFPSSDFDYGRAAVAAFRAEIVDGLGVAARRELDAQSAVDPVTYPDAFPRQWTRFRRSKMTALVARLGTIVRRSRTGARLSISVVADQDEALGRRLQDWRTWADNGFVDILCLEPGSETSEEFEFQVRAARQFSSRAELSVGLGADWLSPFDTFDRIRASQRIGVDGIVVWRYDSVTDRTTQPHDHLRHIGLAIATVPLR